LQKAIEDDPVPPPPRKLPPVNTETVANTEIASTPASSSSHPKA